LISELQRIDAALSDHERERLRVVLVTLDPERDSSARLRTLADERSLPTPRWTLLRTDEETVRELAMVLGVQYRRVGDGQFVHSALVTLLDGEGRIATQLDDVDAPIASLVARAHELLTRDPL
jgi:protein SCO1/2